MEDDGVGGCGHLVGDGEQGVGKKDAHRAQENPAVHPGPVADHNQVGPHHQCRDGGAAAVDRHPAPGDKLHAYPADAVQYSGNKDVKRPSLTRRHSNHFLIKNPSARSSDRGLAH